MLTAARLTEAILKVHGEELRGFAGLRDGLQLMRRMLDECWDRIYPPIEEEGDEEVRAAALSWLDDNDRGARFPLSIRTTPLVLFEGKGLSWKDWKDSNQPSENQEAIKENFSKAVEEAPRETCQSVADDLAECLTEVVELDRVLEAKLGTYAPSISNLRQAVYDCQVLAQQILDAKRPRPRRGLQKRVWRPDPAAVNRMDRVRRYRRGRPAMNSRAQVFQTIAEAARILRQLEPHSPVPFMLERAVELGALPFPELMKVLIRNPDVLTTLGREPGVKGMSEEF